MEKKEFVKKIIIAFSPMVFVYVLNRLGSVCIMVTVKNFSYCTNLYTLFPRYDILMHVLGGFTAAFMVEFVFRLMIESKKYLSIPFFFRLFAILGGVVLIGVFWEWYEFFHDILKFTAFQSSVADTLKDLFFDLFGAVIFCGILLQNKKS